MGDADSRCGEGGEIVPVAGAESWGTTDDLDGEQLLQGTVNQTGVLGAGG
jgi:hypothetical protein